MNKFFKNLSKPLNLVFLFSVLFCLFVSYQYRARSYNYFPPIGETFDELCYGWLGLSLSRTGLPTTWSFIPVYSKGTPKDSTIDLKESNIIVDNRKLTLENLESYPKPLKIVREFKTPEYNSHFDIVFPFIEQPPLGGLLISLPSYLRGAKNFEDVKVADLRKPFIYYGVLSTILVVILAYLWFGKWVALVSGFLYATIPTIVIGSRLAIPENLLTMFLLMHLTALTFYIQTKSKTALYTALLLTFAAPLIKPFGLSLGVIGIGCFLVNKKYKTAGLFLGASIYKHNLDVSI